MPCRERKGGIERAERTGRGRTEEDRMGDKLDQLKKAMTELDLDAIAPPVREVDVGNDELILEAVGPVAVLTLNRPARGNTLTEPLLEALAGTVRSLPSSGARCAVLRGAGGRFSLGMDLNAMAESTAAENQRLIGPGGPLRRAIAAVEECPLPVLAMVRGYAAGAGCELATACDLRAGSEECRMGMPPARLGIVYPAEGLDRFVRAYGLAVTRKLFLTAEYFRGPELAAMGMLDFIWPDDELEAGTMDLAGRLAGLAPLSMRGHKRTLALLSARFPDLEDVEGAMDPAVSEAMASEDAAEGIRAFGEKRPPLFKGE